MWDLMGEIMGSRLRKNRQAKCERGHIWEMSTELDAVLTPQLGIMRDLRVSFIIS